MQQRQQELRRGDPCCCLRDQEDKEDKEEEQKDHRPRNKQGQGWRLWSESVH